MQFLRDFFSRQLYVQLSPTLLTVHDPHTGITVAEVPEIALQSLPGHKRTVVGVGTQARAAAAQPHVQVHNPLAHPRSLVSDFTLAEQLLKAFVRRAVPGAVWLPSPEFIVHPLGEHAGGLTQVELRAMRELALGVGAREVRIWQGPTLTDEQLKSGQFPSTGKVFDA